MSQEKISESPPRLSTSEKTHASVVLSASQLELELLERTEQYFEVDQSSQQDMQKIRCLVECSMCEKLPLVIRQCVVCEAVICNLCRLKHQIKNSDNEMHETASMAAICCPQCEQNPGMQMLPVKNARVLAILKKIKVKRTCCQKNPYDKSIYDK